MRVTRRRRRRRRRRSPSAVAGLRVGVPRRLLDGVDAAIRDGLASTEEAVRAAGASVVDVELDAAEHSVAAYYVIAMAEATSNLSRYDGVRYGPRRQSGGLEAMYEETRALFGKEVRRRLLLGNFVLSAGFYEAYVEQAQKVRTLIARGFDKAFGDVDVILLPTTPTTAPALGIRRGIRCRTTSPTSSPCPPRWRGCRRCRCRWRRRRSCRWACSSSVEPSTKPRSSTSLAPSSFRSGVHE